MHFSSCASYFCFVFFHLPRFVRSRLRRFFLVYAIRCLLRRAIPGMRGPDWSNGALNEVAIKRAKSHAADYAFSRPRASPERTSASDQLPLFPHRPRRALLPSPPPSSHPPLSPVLSLPLILFPPLFFPVSPSHLSSWSLFISRPAPYLAPWESARAIRAAREEVLIPVSRHCFSPFASSRSIRDVTSSRESTLVDLTELCVTILLVVRSMQRESSLIVVIENRKKFFHYLFLLKKQLKKILNDRLK